MSRYLDTDNDDPRRASLRSSYEYETHSPTPVDKTLHKVELKLRAQRGSVNLNLADAFIGDEGCEVLAAYLREHPEIATLDLKGNNITAGGLRVLATALRCSRLRSLSLEWNSIGSETEALTEAFGFSETLQHLDLRNNRIGIAGAEPLAKLISLNKSLVTLDLRWNELGSQGAMSILSALQGRHYVRNIEISGNRVPDELLSQFEELAQSTPTSSLKSPRYASPISFSRSSPLRASAQADTFVTEKRMSQEQEYAEELQSKYEGQLLALTRSQSRISELELRLDQEVKRSQDARQELLKDLEGERYQRCRAEEALLVMKEGSLQREMDDSKATQELELRLNRAQSEKTLLNNELDRLKASFEHFQSSSAERLRALDDRLSQQQKAYRQLEETSRLSSDRARGDHYTEVKGVSQIYEAKLAEAQDHLHDMVSEKEALERALQTLQTQVIELKSLHAEELVRTEDEVRETEAVKFNAALRNLEARMKAGEESREQLSRRNQDLQRELSRTEQRAFDTALNLENQLNQEKEDRDEITRQLQALTAALEAHRNDLHISNLALDRLQIEKDELIRTLAQRKDQHNKLIEKLYSEQSTERKLAEQGRNELDAEIGKLERQLSQTEKERDHFLGAYSRLADVLKAGLSQCIQETVLAHVQRVSST